MTGHTKEVTFLKNWLVNSASNIAKIPESFIVSWLIPSNDMLKLYDIQIKSDSNPRETNIKKIKPPSTDNPLMNDMSGFKDFMNDSSIEDKNNEYHQFLKDIYNDLNKKKSDDDCIFMHMNMMLPPDLLRELFEEGSFNLDDIEFTEEDEEYFNNSIHYNEYTGEDINSPNYGNRWTDWHPDPNNDEYS